MHWHDLIYKMGRHLPGSHTKKRFPWEICEPGMAEAFPIWVFVETKVSGCGKHFTCRSLLFKSNRPNNWGRKLKEETKEESFEQFIQTSLYLVGTYIRIFYFLFKFFRNAVTFLKVEWLSNLSCKVYNVITAFHNRNKQKKVFAACYFQLILAMTAGFIPC